MIVLDCSVTMSWCFEDENSYASADLLQSLKHETAIVPAIWGYEVCNVLYIAEKKGIISNTEIEKFIKLLNNLDIELDTSNKMVNSEIIKLCKNYSLSAYGAAYLELALRFNIPLASFDTQLCKAAERCGIITPELAY